MIPIAPPTAASSEGGLQVSTGKPTHTELRPPGIRPNYKLLQLPAHIRIKPRVSFSANRSEFRLSFLGEKGLIMTTMRGESRIKNVSQTLLLSGVLHTPHIGGGKKKKKGRNRGTKRTVYIEQIYFPGLNFQLERVIWYAELLLLKFSRIPLQ